MIGELPEHTSLAHGRGKTGLWAAIAVAAAIIAVLTAAVLRPGPLFEKAGAEADSAIVELEKRGYPGP